MEFSFKGTFFTKILFPIIGIFLILGGKSSYNSTSDFIDNSLVEQGQVINLLERESEDSITYAPVIRYSDLEGKNHEFVSGASSNPPSYQIGESVEILYLKSNPERVEVKSFFSLWGGATIMFLIGIAFFSFGFIPTCFALYSKIQKK